MTTHATRVIVLAVTLALVSACSPGKKPIATQPSGGSSASSARKPASDVNNAREATKTEGVTRLEYDAQGWSGSTSVTIRSAKWGKKFESGGKHLQDIELNVEFANIDVTDFEPILVTTECINRPNDSPNQHSGPIDMSDPLRAGSRVGGLAIISVELPCEPGWISWEPRFEHEFRWPLPATR